MNSGPPDGEPTSGLPRAGFWRRFWSLIIDTVIVIVPFQVLAVILFTASAGMVQMNSGLFYLCEVGKSVPQGLDPPPPHDSNFIRVCRTSFFGATTGAILTVGRVTSAAHTTTTVTQGYMLDKDGTPVKGVSIDWIFQVTLLVYLVGMICKTGRTLGGRAAGIRVTDVTNPEAAGVPLGKAIIRYLAIFIGAVPAFALLGYQYVAAGGGADEMFSATFFQWFQVAGAIGGIWTIVLIVQIARKKDPVYDRLAGTAVLKVSKPRSAPPTIPQGA
jgi:RDD family